MSDTFINAIIFFVVILFMGNVASSLQQIAKSLRVIAGRYDPKPPTGDPEGRIDA